MIETPLNRSRCDDPRRLRELIQKVSSLASNHDITSVVVGMSGDDLVFAINIPQESVTIPETIDAVRAAMEMQVTGKEAVAATDGYLGI